MGRGAQRFAFACASTSQGPSRSSSEHPPPPRPPYALLALRGGSVGTRARGGASFAGQRPLSLRTSANRRCYPRMSETLSLIHCRALRHRPCSSRLIAPRSLESTPTGHRSSRSDPSGQRVEESYRTPSSEVMPSQAPDDLPGIDPRSAPRRSAPESLVLMKLLL